MSDPYLIGGPALISFSGGRTSAYMLHQIVKAHGGALPDDVVVAFANTGKEREETLRFVHECGSRWGVRIRWVERRAGKPGFEEVEFNSASREGEPFETLIAKKKRLPNWQQRWCTAMLKVDPMQALMLSRGLEPGTYSEAIGLRADERVRVERAMERRERSGRRLLWPLARAGVTKADVMGFWSAQPFDLGLRPHEGNCDLCMLKGRGIKKALIRDRPGVADWWREQEERLGQQFDRRDSVAGLMEEARADLFAAPIDGDEYDVECGDACGVA